jgi:hypothetical protein
LNPVSLLALSIQVRLIWLDEVAVATRLEGAAGTAEPPDVVVPLTSFDGAEFPLLLTAETV